jgi:hypothetical protein
MPGMAERGSNLLLVLVSTGILSFMPRWYP